MESSRSESSSGAWEAQLELKIKGEIVNPDNPKYDEAKSGFNLMVNQRPALIILPENAQDVLETVRLAREEDLEVAVQSTVHGVGRPADGCLLIRTSNMTDIKVDTASQTAWISAGARWGHVLLKTQAHGLAPLLGSSPDVGVVGYTLGGGFGWLGRKYGLAADSVNYFELVTADGQLLRASAEENPDLFWGLRGGGSSLGIITGMEIKLYPVSTVYGGFLVYPIETAAGVLTRFREWVESVPEEMTSSVALMNLPPLPMVPEFLRGKSAVMVRGCYCGPVEEGEALIQGWRDWQAPFMDAFRVMPFSEVATISNDPEGPIPGLSSGAWLEELSADAIDILLRYMAPEEGISPILMTEIRHAGGVISRVDADTAAYGNRDAELLMQIVGMTPTPEAYDHLEQYIARFKEELKPFLTGTVYMNFLEGQESQERVKDGFSPEAFERLIQLKAAVDPDNRFSYGFNIPPIGGTK